MSEKNISDFIDEAISMLEEMGERAGKAIKDFSESETADGLKKGASTAAHGIANGARMAASGIVEGGHMAYEAVRNNSGKNRAESSGARYYDAYDSTAKGEVMNVYSPVKEGKVREIYDTGDSLILVATDRISAFDHILKNSITGKGKILTQMSKFWFDYTKDIVDNHMVSTDVKDMPEYFRNARFEGRSMMVRKLRMLPIECIVRGYITGSGWASYKENGTVCGIRLPEGLQESEQLPEPIYTPSTKAEIGDHDENISFERSVEVLEKEFPGHGQEYAEKIRDYTIAVYKKCADYAKSKGIIIADTKFEFGLGDDGEVILADEVLTPDSSRFWPAAEYVVGQGEPSYDKQYVRDWLKANPDSDYDLPQDVIDKTIEKYREAYELLTK